MPRSFIDILSDLTRNIAIFRFDLFQSAVNYYCNLSWLVLYIVRFCHLIRITDSSTNVYLSEKRSKRALEGSDTLEDR